MTCSRCGHTPPAGSPFCNGCGARLEVSCASCGTTPPPGTKFCNGCGATLGATPPSTAPAGSPRTYTPKHLADKILQSKSSAWTWAEHFRAALLAQAGGFNEWRGAIDRAIRLLRDHNEQDMLPRGCSDLIQGTFLAVYADSCMVRGDAQAAISKAREGIVAADTGIAWFQGALARTVLADALIHAGALDAEGRAVIAEARELVRNSGGNSLLPRLREAEARLAGRNDRVALQAGLREAEAMYRAMGAPDPADRLAREVAA